MKPKRKNKDWIGKFGTIMYYIVMGIVNLFWILMIIFSILYSIKQITANTGDIYAISFWGVVVLIIISQCDLTLPWKILVGNNRKGER